MKDVVIVSIGYSTYALVGKPAAAGKLLELLSDIVEVRSGHEHGYDKAQTFRIRPRPVEVKVEMTTRMSLLPPSKEDMEEEGSVEVKTITGATRLLTGGRR